VDVVSKTRYRDIRRLRDVFAGKRVAWLRQRARDEEVVAAFLLSRSTMVLSFVEAEAPTRCGH
jgi:hypothetical protein